MLYLVIKAALSGVIVALVSEIARRNPGAGGLLRFGTRVKLREAWRSADA